MQGLSPGYVGIEFEAKRKNFIKAKDSEYVRRAKTGGYKDLLHMREEGQPAKEGDPKFFDTRVGEYTEDSSTDLTAIRADETEYMKAARNNGTRDLLATHKMTTEQERAEYLLRVERNNAGINPDKKGRPPPYRVTEDPELFVKTPRTGLRPLPSDNYVPPPYNNLSATQERMINLNKARNPEPPYTTTDNLHVWQRGPNKLAKPTLEDRLKGRRPS